MINLTLLSAAKVRLMIAESGKTLRGFAKEIGISHAYLSQILAQKKNPSPTVAYKIAGGLNKEITDIFLIESVDKTYTQFKKEVKAH